MIEPNLKISLILLSSGESRKDENEENLLQQSREEKLSEVVEQNASDIVINDIIENNEVNNLEEEDKEKLDLPKITPKKLVVDLKRMKIPRDGMISTGPSDSEEEFSSVKSYSGPSFKKPDLDRFQFKENVSVLTPRPDQSFQNAYLQSLPQITGGGIMKPIKLEPQESCDELRKIKQSSESDLTMMSDDSDDDRTTTEEIADEIIKPTDIKIETDLKCEEIIKDKSHDDTDNDEAPDDGLPVEKRLFKCLQCDKVYRKKKSLMCHSHQHHPGWCPLCGKYYGCTPPEMAEHNREFHIKDHPYICEECGECFKRNQQFQVHVEVHMKRKKKAMEALKTDHDEEKKKIYTCEICSTEFKLLKCYEKHCQESHKLEGFMCELCGSHFKDKFSLQQHNFKVHKKEIACPHCPKKFAYKSNLDRHILLHSDNKKSYICEQCGAPYSTPMALKEHYSYAHKKVKDFKCNLCDKAFSAKRALQRHQVVHSDDRPFKCGLCSRTFKIKSNLVRHNQSHKESGLDGKIKRLIKDENGELVEAIDDDDIEVETAIPPKPIKIRRKRKQNVNPPQIPSQIVPPPVIDGNNFMDMMNSEMQQYPMQAQQNMGMMQMDSNLNQNYGTYNNDQLESSINNILNQSQFQNDYTQTNYNIQPDCNWSNVPSQNNMSGYSLVDVNSESLMSLQLKSDPNHRSDSGQIMDIPNADLIHYQDIWNTSGHSSHIQYSNNIDQNPANNTYSNIGSILTNLEMMDNQTNSMPDSSIALAGVGPNVYHHESEMSRNQQNHPQSQHSQHQQMEQSHLNYDFNSQNHTITDISNTFIKEDPTVIACGSNSSGSSSSSSNVTRLTNAIISSSTGMQQKRDSNGGMNDVMESIELNQKQMKEIMLQNTNENVTLPSLIDYLQHPYQF